MLDKFYNIPIESDTTVLFKKEIRIYEYDVLS